MGGSRSHSKKNSKVGKYLLLLSEIPILEKNKTGGYKKTRNFFSIAGGLEIVPINAGASSKKLET